MLVGRRGELRAIDRALDALGAGQPGVLEITGEPGIGKSRLIAETCKRADERHALTLAGRASEFERDVPFGVFVDALDDYLGALNPRKLELLGNDGRRELGVVFPALADASDGGPPGALPTERYRSHRAVRLLLDSLAVSTPLVLALDDVHWADDASLELLSHLLRKRSSAPTLLVVAYRARQQPRLIAGALSVAERDGGLTRVEPPPLTAAEADELILGDSPLDAAARELLYRDSGGNPFYLEQLHRARSTRPPTRPASPLPAAEPRSAPGEVPPAVAAAIDDEVKAVSPRAQTLLRGAAVVGSGARNDPGVRVVAATAGMSEDEALETLDELLAADLIRPTDVPLRFRFRHPIVLHAVYESAGGGWLIGAHARAAAALGETGAQATMRAHHLERSAGPGDEAAIEVLIQAGHASSSRAPAAAARWFRGALRLLPEGPESDGRRLELLVPLATALGAAGQLDDARDALDQVLKLIPPELAAVRARLTTLRAHVDNLRGDHGAAHALLIKELALVRADEPLIETDLQLALASDRFFAGDWEGMWEWAHPALAVARNHADRPLHAAAAAHCGGAAYLTERLEDCAALLDEAAGIVDGLRDDEVAQRIESLHWLGWCEEFFCRYEESVAHLQRGIDVSRANGQGHLLVGLMTAMASSLSCLGRLDDAIEAADAAVETAHLASNDQFLSWALTSRCVVALMRGEVADAIQAGEQAVELSKGDPVSALSGVALGAAQIENGEPAAGRDSILASSGGPDLPMIERPFRTHCYELLTRAEIALGDLAAAARWVDLADDAASGCPELGVRQGEALRARAELLLAGGDPVSAAERALAAAAAAADAPVECGRARTLAGRALAAAGDKARAAQELERAVAVLGELGARRYCDAAARELRRLGRKSPGRKRSRAAGVGGGVLSPREREIAELVTGGKTNRQIAAELFLSEKTVETHLSHVFAKLGVSSRASVAAELASARSEQPA